MRTLRFRAWHKLDDGSGEFVPNCVVPVCAINFDQKTVTVENNIGEEDWSMDDCVLMQSTGLTDKSGKEIFEGDIVEWRCDGEPPEGLFEVFWRPAQFVLTDRKTDPWSMQGRKHLVIVGNIYENPDLLPAP